MARSSGGVPSAPEPPQRRLDPLPPRFAADDGSSEPRLAAALTAYGSRPEDAVLRLEVLRALLGARLLVPVVAVLGEVEYDAAGLAHDKTSDMATALLTGRDGRQALLAFTGLEPLARWRPDARPVPVTAELAAQSALQEGAHALVVDVAGPVPFPVEGQLLEGLARGWTLVQTSEGPAWMSQGPPAGG